MTAPASRAGLSGVAWLGIAAAGGLIVLLAAGYLGYRTQQSQWPLPRTVATAAASEGTRAGSPLTQRKRALASAGSGASASSPLPEVVRPTTQAGNALPGSNPPAPLTWPLWEFRLRQAVPPRDPPLTPVSWRLIGANQSGGAWSIVVLRQGKAAPEFFKVGDSLPGGYRVQSITEEDVTLVKDRRPVTLSYIGSR